MDNPKVIKEVIDFYYDKHEDGELWHHPMMDALMAILERDGYTPMGKDTQICLVKAALHIASNYITPTSTDGE